MNKYLIPEDHLFRLLEICHNENNCIQGDTDCLCQQALTETEEVKELYPSNLKELFK